MQSNIEHDFFNLTPEAVLAAVEAFGLPVDGRFVILNSYENRVYQVGIEDQRPVVAKFYRPNRWSDEAIQEEHDFTQQLAAVELPIVAPLRDAEQRSLLNHQGYRFALYPCQGGRAPEAGDAEQIYRISMLMARIHNIGAEQAFANRPNIDVESYCQVPFAFCLENDFIPIGLHKSFEQIIQDLLPLLNNHFQNKDVQLIRCHGDCHLGNILWTEDKGAHFVDFDDCRMSVSIQDLWMLTAGEEHEQKAQWSEIMEGYSQFRDFPHHELRLIEPLRTLRLIHTAGWLARRWHDPAFPKHFPWFAEQHYWQQLYHDLSKQLRLIKDQD